MKTKKIGKTFFIFFLQGLILIIVAFVMLIKYHLYLYGVIVLLDGIFNFIIAGAFVEIEDNFIKIDKKLYTKTDQTVVSIGNANITRTQFSSRQDLKDVELLDSVICIGESAFEGCHSLERIFIPNSVKYVAANVFVDCPILTIYCDFESQPTDWDDNWNPDNRPVVWGHKDNIMQKNID